MSCIIADPQPLDYRDVVIQYQTVEGIPKILDPYIRESSNAYRIRAILVPLRRNRSCLSPSI